MLWNSSLFRQPWQNPFSGFLARVRGSGGRLAAQVAARIAGDGDPYVAQQAAWRRDPLSHPDLQAMSQRALDDLPFDPHAFTED